MILWRLLCFWKEICVHQGLQTERGLDMLYCLKKEEIEKLKKTYLLPEFINAEMLSATYITDENVVKEIIPKPLLPTKIPLATVFVARYPETNFGCFYLKKTFFLVKKHKIW